MGDPERLLSGKSALDLPTRELLETLRELSPPAHAGVESWATMAAKIAGGTALASASLLHTAKWGLPKALLVKAGLALSVAGAAFAVWAVWVPHNRSPSPVTSPSAAVAAVAGSAPAPSAATPNPTEEPEAVAPPAESVSARTGSARATQQSQLDAEAALLTKARSELRQGNPEAAQNTLNRLQATFPKGILAQEREVLAIEVLNRAGHTAAAKRKARAFVAAYPASPHVATLQPLLEGQ